jgi:hypothetical protein
MFKGCAKGRIRKDIFMVSFEVLFRSSPRETENKVVPKLLCSCVLSQTAVALLMKKVATSVGG